MAAQRGHNIVGCCTFSRTSEIDWAAGTIDHGTWPSVVVLGLIAVEVVTVNIMHARSTFPICGECRKI